jgi:hypothetical protein
LCGVLLITVIKAVQYKEGDVVLLLPSQCRM